MLLSRLTQNFIVHQSGNEVLQSGSQLVDGGLVDPAPDLDHQHVVGLHDLLVGVSKIILTSVCATHCDTRSHRGRGDSQVLDNHVLRARDFRAETHQLTVFIRNPLKDAKGLIGLVDLLPILASAGHLLGRIRVLDDDFESTLGELGLLLAATTSVVSALSYGVTNSKNLPEASLVVLSPPNLVHHWLVGLVNQELGAVVAHASEHLPDVLNESSVENREGELHVAEVAGTLLMVYTEFEFKIFNKIC